MIRDQDALKDLLDDPIADEQLERVRRRMRETRARPAPRRRAPYAIAAAIVIAATAFAVWQATDIETPGPIRLASGEPFRSAVGRGERTRIDLDDGSTIWLSNGARVTVKENDGSRLVLAQSDGRVGYAVRPHGPRAWRVGAGAAAVEVIGTRFSVDHAPARVRVAVTRGRVRVESPAQSRELGAGESIEILPSERPSEEMGTAQMAMDELARARARELEAPTETPSLDEADAPEPTLVVRDSRASNEWRRLAEEGEHDEAFALLGEDGMAAATRRASSPAELFALADTARLSGHPALAVAPLRRIIDEHSGDSRAGVAAVTLGRLELDALGDPSSAVRTLGRALELGVPERLRETVLARLVEAHGRSGDRIRAVETAHRYLAAYPNGLHADAMRRVISGE